MKSLSPVGGVAILVGMWSLGWVRVAVFSGLVLAFGLPANPASAKKVIRLEAIKVEGRIQKPQAFYILQRSNLNFKGVELKASFLSKIAESVDNKPF